MEKPKRYLLPDTIRGILILAMVTYHTLYDLYYIFGVSMPWFRSEPVRIFQLSILFGFIFLSGFCCTIGTPKLRRGIEVSIFGLVITIATCIFIPDEKIICGVLSCIGLCMILATFLYKPLTHIPLIPGIIIFFLLTALTYGIQYHYIGFFSVRLVSVPDWFYKTNFFFLFGFRNKALVSSDYVPLLPWFFLYLLGFYFGKWFLGSTKRKSLLQNGIRPLAFLGKKSLWIYIAHQPLIYGILWLILKIK